MKQVPVRGERTEPDNLAILGHERCLPYLQTREYVCFGV